MNGLKEKNVLVTGASSGIGQSIAIRFAQEGANVALNYLMGDAAETEAQIHHYETCAKEARGCGVKVVQVQADISKEADVQRMVQQTVDELGGLDILVNNAGIQISAESDMLDTSKFDKVLGVNLRGAFMAAREAVSYWLRTNQPGVIINVSSVHQTIPKPKYLGYSVSKGGMANLTRTLALEYASRGIRVNAIAPGATITPINRAWIDDPIKREMVQSHIPMRRAGTSEEMAAATAFLASDEGAYITGQTLYIDGGLTLYPSFETAWSSE
ncbi:MAG: glucose 1-dehydrogenase [Thermaceae bacterium]|nr:glucose 1-dehydrogenase [Thermaceae bacterium]